METNYQTLVSKYLTNGFYTAYGESHGATLEPEDIENDNIERPGFNDDDEEV